MGGNVNKLMNGRGILIASISISSHPHITAIKKKNLFKSRHLHINSKFDRKLEFQRCISIFKKTTQFLNKNRLKQYFVHHQQQCISPCIQLILLRLNYNNNIIVNIIIIIINKLNFSKQPLTRTTKQFHKINL